MSGIVAGWPNEMHLHLPANNTRLCVRNAGPAPFICIFLATSFISPLFRRLILKDVPADQVDEPQYAFLVYFSWMHSWSVYATRKMTMMPTTAMTACASQTKHPQRCTPIMTGRAQTGPKQVHESFRVRAARMHRSSWKTLPG